MKPSHFTTPRSTHECVFIASADPIERLRPSTDYGTLWWVAFSLTAVFAAIVIVLTA